MDDTEIAETKRQERVCGFPCQCGAKDYEDAANKCVEIGEDSNCPSMCMFVNYIAVE